MADLDLIKNRSKHKARLDDIGVATLPNQPGKRGFTAEEVKGHFKAPIDYLFALLAKNAQEVGYDLDSLTQAVENINQTVIDEGFIFTPALGDRQPSEIEKVHVWLDTGSELTGDEGIVLQSERIAVKDTDATCVASLSSNADVEVIKASPQSSDIVVDVDKASFSTNVIDMG